jgi:class 3 adenylate cyclase
VSNINCAACGHALFTGAKFCPECGVPCAARCVGCAAELPPAAKFCAECGTPVAAAPTVQPVLPPASRSPRDYTPKHLAEKILNSKSALEGERKQVTVLFADIQGSMQLATQLDAESWHELLERYFAILNDAVHRFEGTVNQYTGDGIMALFGAPIAHEDHAQRACYAALEARDRLREFADELRVAQGLNFSCRIGLNSGDVVVGKIGEDLRMDYTAQGATVGIAQRIEQLAAPGHVYLSGATERLVAGYFQLRPMGKTDLKGLAEALPLFELEAPGSARNRLDVAATRGLSRFVGRIAEMQTLEAALANAESGHGQVIGVVGEAGLGKSRLCFEFVEHCRGKGVPVFEAHCPAHGKNIPYLPILELLRNYFDIKADDNARQARQKIAGTLALLDATLQEASPVLFEFMAVGDPDDPAPAMDAEAKQRQLYELIHRLIRAQDARGQVSVTLIDDLHWIDAGSDGFVNQLVSAVEGKHALVVLNFRPEYRAAFAARAHYQQLPLVPLGDAPLRELITDLIGRDDSVAELSERVIEWTTGNPFYTEEVINALAEAGDLAGHPGHYRLTTAVEQIVVPTNVQAVLAARIDRLPDPAKRLLQTAAVIGKGFRGPLLEAVTDLLADEYASAIERLKAGDFIFERALYPVFEYAFKHPLTHQVAYQSQLRSRRAVVHAAVAHALEADAGDKLDEQAALLAHHCEEAGEVLNAARWHQRAAEWAGLNDPQAAMRHWQRVRELARSSGDDAASTSVLAHACSRAVMMAGRVGTSPEMSAEIFAEGCAAAERIGNLTVAASLNANYGMGRGLNQADGSDYVRYATAGVRIADRTADPALRAGTRAALAWGHLYCGQLHEGRRVADEAIAIASGDIHLGADVWGNSPLLASRNVRAHAIGCGSDPAMALVELAEVRQTAIETGYSENAVFALALEMELRYAIGDSAGIHALTQIATQLAENRGVLNELVAAIGGCDALATDKDWGALLIAATDTLRSIRERGAGRNWESRLLALIGIAQLELDDPAASRASALEGVDAMRESRSVWNPHSYAVLARAQFALSEPAADIAFTLDDYESLLTRTGFHVYEGELHELRAQLAAREGRSGAHAAAIARAHECYTRFGMTAQAARVAAAIKGPDGAAPKATK